MLLFVSIFLFCKGLLVFANKREDKTGYPVDYNRLDPVFDTIREDDAYGDFELGDIIFVAKGSAEDDIDAYSEEDRQLYVDTLNAYRSNFTHPFPEGSDNHRMEYNRTLEWTAMEFCKYCRMAHWGYAASDNMSDLQGQNLYKGPAHYPHRPIWAFYYEYRWFNFQNYSCLPLPLRCGHLTTLMWWNTTRVGGGRRSHCWPREPFILVCHHFLIKGNYKSVGFDFYRYGETCTRCPPGYLCHGNLCAEPRQCRDSNLDCECVRKCRNCGVADFRRCSCACRAGWDWEDCSYPCENAADRDFKVVFCRRHYASQECPRKLFWQACRHFCGYCNGPDKAAELGTCCNGTICQPHHVLHEETCECQLVCPSKVCPYGPKAPLNVAGTFRFSSSLLQWMMLLLLQHWLL